MIVKTIPAIGAFEIWRNAARELLHADVRPEDIRWDNNAKQQPLFGGDQSTPKASHQSLTVPKEFISLARKITAHHSEERFAWAYKILWRLQREPLLLSNPADADLRHVQLMAKSVSRDCHKMKAFVRFRELEHGGDRRQFGAWFEPEHYIVELTGTFFANRFADMDWVISTPHAVAIFKNGELSYAPGDGSRHAATDETEKLWRTYYANIFNPARLKIKAMEREMPRKYWKNLPEATLIPELISGAAQRVQQMRDQLPSQPPIHLEKFKAPAITSAVIGDHYTAIADVQSAAMHCTRCTLHCNATQTVFGEGPQTAAVMFVGEQPGDEEDIAGTPFIGPAGRIFNKALAAAGIDRSEVYVTNAVKHFKFSPRGKRRIHQRPNTSEIQQCKWWLEKEIALIQPKLIVALGATALMALTGENVTLKGTRGKILTIKKHPSILPTYHPSAILRNEGNSSVLQQDFFADIASIKKHIDNFQTEGTSMFVNR